MQPYEQITEIDNLWIQLNKQEIEAMATLFELKEIG